jgi:hypothetical protein
LSRRQERTELLDAQAKNALLIMLEPAKRSSLDECSVAKIKELDASIQTAKSISQAHASCLYLLQAIGCDAPAELANANCDPRPK